MTEKIQWRGWHVETESNYEDTKSLEGKFRTLKMKIQDQVKLEVKNIQMSVKDLVQNSISEKFKPHLNDSQGLCMTHLCCNLCQDETDTYFATNENEGVLF